MQVTSISNISSNKKQFCFKTSHLLVNQKVLNAIFILQQKLLNDSQCIFCFRKDRKPFVPQKDLYIAEYY